MFQQIHQAKRSKANRISVPQHSLYTHGAAVLLLRRYCRCQSLESDHGLKQVSWPFDAQSCSLFASFLSMNSSRGANPAENIQYRGDRVIQGNAPEDPLG